MLYVYLFAIGATMFVLALIGLAISFLVQLITGVEL